MKAPHLVAITCATCLFGCSLFSALGWDFRSPATRAQGLASRCSNYWVERTPLLFTPSTIEKVEGAYSYVQSGAMNREARLRGALLHLGPEPGLTREALQRAVECHQAHVLLGREKELPHDPYTLAGQWLDIDANSEGDGFTVAVQTDKFPTAKEVLDRAREFVATR